MDAELRSALPQRACGAPFYPRSLGVIREVIESSRDLGRQQIIRQCCERLGWVDHRGAPKISSARPVLLEFHQRGWITLPEVTATSNGRPKTKPASPSSDLPADFSLERIECSLQQIRNITLRSVESSSDAHLWRGLMAHYHYLGHTPHLFGCQIRYLVESDQGILGAMSFSAAAGRVKDRDRWIGWSVDQRRENRHLLLNNSRFLILPTVQVSNLASHLLAKAARQLPNDFDRRYGVRPLLLESYVDQARYAGTCYRAANWIEVGKSSGRGRSDQRPAAQRRSEPPPLSIKSIWLYPLQSPQKVRNSLCSTHADHTAGTSLWRVA